MQTPKFQIFAPQMLSMAKCCPRQRPFTPPLGKWDRHGLPFNVTQNHRNQHEIDWAVGTYDFYL